MNSKLSSPTTGFMPVAGVLMGGQLDGICATAPARGAVY